MRRTVLPRNTLAVMTLSILIGAPARGGPTAPDSCGEWPFGFNRVVAIDPDRDLFFASSGGAVIIHNTDTPEAPELLSDTIRTGGLVRDMFFESSTERLYIAADEGGLEVWSVADPVNPVMLGQLDLRHFIVKSIVVPTHGVVVHEGVAYVAADIGGVQSVDVSNPADMFSFSATLGGVPGSALNLVSAKHVVYANGFVFAAGSDFIKFEIRPDGSLRGIQGADIGGRPFVSGDLAYLIGSGHLIMVDAVGFNPAITRILPILGSYTTTSNARDVFVQCNTAYVVDPFAGLSVLDVTLPSTVFEIGSLSDVAAVRVLVSGSTAFTTGPGGHLIDVADNRNPVTIATIPASGSAVYSAEEEGHYVFLANLGLGLTVVDVSDPAMPVTVTSVSTPDIALDVKVLNHTAYVACRESGLRIFDIQSPTQPVEIGFADGFDYARRVFVQGDFAYVTDLTLGVRVIDLTDLTNPSEAAFIPTPDFAHATFAASDRLYVAGDAAGLLVFDITDPRAPTPMGSANTPGYATGVEVIGDLAYVGDFGGGLRVIDVSNPFAPFEVGSYDPGGLTANQLSVRDGIAYVADAGAGISLIDVSDPSHPTEMDFIDSPGSAFDVSTFGERLYVSDGAAGLRVYGACTLINAADVNGDGNIDLNDFDMFVACTTGPNGHATPQCAPADIDADGDIDFSDFALFQTLFAG